MPLIAEEEKAAQPSCPVFFRVPTLLLLPTSAVRRRPRRECPECSPDQAQPFRSFAHTFPTHTGGGTIALRPSVARSSDRGMRPRLSPAAAAAAASVPGRGRSGAGNGRWAHASGGIKRGKEGLSRPCWMSERENEAFLPPAMP